MELYNSDCLEVMDKLIDKKIQVDLTVTSPPYDNLRKYDGVGVLWNEDVWKQVIKKLYNITKEGGIVVWVVGDATINGSETGTSFKQALYAKEIGFNLHDTMIYAKNNYVPLTHNRYEQQFEYMFIFSKNKPKTFNSIKIATKTAGENRSFDYECATTREKNAAMRSGKKRVIKIKKEKIKPNIWFYNIGNNSSTKDKIAFQHPAIFPEQLAYDHIVSWSNENDIVFDPFMGSGTTGKMAVLNNRNFIGIELDEKYFQIAKERIAKAEKDKKGRLF